MVTSSPSSASTSPLVESRRPGTIYLHSGIGGAGNIYQTTASDPLEIKSSSRRPSAPHSHRGTLPRSLRSFFGNGVGGAGNVHPLSEAFTLTQQEELARARTQESNYPDSWYVGVGGRGNKTSRVSSRQSSVRGNSIDSTASSMYSEKALPLGAAHALRVRVVGRKGSDSS
ncbi:hypothetical protein MMC20_006724 [Loxospora ochrophaea]|nr:hypothetical protein [Loxospora ochrophaea]